MYPKNPQQCSILLKSSACCVTQPCNTQSIARFRALHPLLLLNCPTLLIYQLHPNSHLYSYSIYALYVLIIMWDYNDNNLTRGNRILHEQEYNTGHGISAIPDEIRGEIRCQPEV